jgi:hypothetical protein
MVGYLCLHPDLPMTFNQATVPKEVSSINFELLDPELVHLLDNVPATLNLDVS